MSNIGFGKKEEETDARRKRRKGDSEKGSVHRYRVAKEQLGRCSVMLKKMQFKIVQHAVSKRLLKC